MMTSADICDRIAERLGLTVADLGVIWEGTIFPLDLFVNANIRSAEVIGLLLNAKLGALLHASTGDGERATFILNVRNPARNTALNGRAGKPEPVSGHYYTIEAREAGSGVFVAATEHIPADQVPAAKRNIRDTAEEGIRLTYTLLDEGFHPRRVTQMQATAFLSPIRRPSLKRR